MGLRDLAYRLYERRLEASLSGHSIPRHVGVILDGNRRWARLAGLADVSHGHQKGADHIFELLGWCRQVGVEVVTLWLLSTDNLSRSGAEVEALLRIIESTVRAGGAGLARQAGRGARPAAGGDGAGAQGRGRGHRGQPGAAGERGRRVRRAAGDRRRGRRSLLHDHATKGTSIEELAEILDVEHIADLCTRRAARPRPGDQRPRGSSGWAGSCCGRAPPASLRSSTSATPTGRASRPGRFPARPGATYAGPGHRRFRALWAEGGLTRA